MPNCVCCWSKDRKQCRACVTDPFAALLVQQSIVLYSGHTTTISTLWRRRRTPTRACLCSSYALPHRATRYEHISLLYGLFMDFCSLHSLPLPNWTSVLTVMACLIWFYETLKIRYNLKMHSCVCYVGSEYLISNKFSLLWSDAPINLSFLWVDPTF